MPKLRFLQALALLALSRPAYVSGISGHPRRLVAMLSRSYVIACAVCAGVRYAFVLESEPVVGRSFTRCLLYVDLALLGLNKVA